MFTLLIEVDAFKTIVIVLNYGSRVNIWN